MSNGANSINQHASVEVVHILLGIRIWQRVGYVPLDIFQMILPMHIKSKSWLRIITAFLLVGMLGYLIAAQYHIISLPDAARVQYTPDDGYYYLTLARNFAGSGSWTFDGRNPTSGFHPAWAYLLVGLYRGGQPGDYRKGAWRITERASPQWRALSTYH